MYQTAPQNQSELTAPLAIELFTRFFNRLLEKEYRFPHFQTELESFKSVLTKQPFDLDGVFIHLAKIQSTSFDKGPLSPYPTSEVSPIGANTFLRALDDYKIKIDSADELSLSARLERRTNPSLSAPPSDPNRRLSVQVYGSGYLSEDPIQSAAPLSANYLATNYSSNQYLETSSPDLGLAKIRSNQLFETSDVNLTKTKSGDVHEYRTSADLFTLLLEPSVSKKHDMTFLASKSRLLKENINTHSDGFIHKTQNKKDKAFNLEERTPLRKFVVYAKGQESAGSRSPQKMLQTAAEEFTLKYQNNQKTLPYNHFTLINY